MTKQLKAGLSIHTHICGHGCMMGETVYTVCDSIGSIFTTIHESQLERFYTYE